MKYLIALILISLALNGCSVLGGERAANDGKQAAPAPAAAPASPESELEPIDFTSVPTSTPAPASQSPAETPPTLSDVEIVWEIPREPVSKYVIYYGPSADRLDKSVVVETQDLEQLDDAAAGFVYRYDLKGIPANQRLFVSISSVTASGESVRSAPIEVK